MCQIKNRLQTCVVTKADGSRQVKETMMSPLSQGVIIPQTNDVLYTPDYVEREWGAYHTQKVHWTDEIHCVIDIWRGEAFVERRTFLKPPCMWSAAVVGADWGFTYFRFFPDGSIECRDRTGQLWKFSPEATQYIVYCACEECIAWKRKCESYDSDDESDHRCCPGTPPCYCSESEHT
jgi:hypothetical protein